MKLLSVGLSAGPQIERQPKRFSSLLLPLRSMFTTLLCTVPAAPCAQLNFRQLSQRFKRRLQRPIITYRLSHLGSPVIFEKFFWDRDSS